MSNYFSENRHGDRDLAQVPPHYEGSAVIRDLISKPIELGRVAVLLLDRIATRDIRLLHILH